jgi:hypothetical protein
MDTLHFFIPQHLWPNSRQIDDSVICRRSSAPSAAPCPSGLHAQLRAQHSSHFFSGMFGKPAVACYLNELFKFHVA